MDEKQTNTIEDAIQKVMSGQLTPNKARAIIGLSPITHLMGNF